MKDHPQLKETENVVNRIMKAMRKHKSIGKKEFEMILQKVMQEVEKNTGVEPDKITEKTSKVIEDMPNEYGQLSEKERSWESMIGYLYAKYLKELGVLK